MFVLQYFKNKKRIKNAAIGLYDAISHHCRQVEFYRDMGVANDLDGRFHLQLLVISTLCVRLNKSGDMGEKLSQALFDVFFKRVEMALREQGIGDMGIPRRMKARMEHFNGCVHRLDDIFGDKMPVDIAGDQLNAMVDQCVYQNITALDDVQGRGAMQAYYQAYCNMIFQAPFNNFMDKKIDFAALKL